MIRALSPKQERVARLVGRGLSYGAIATQLSLSPRTVERYVYIASDRIDDDVDLNITPYRRVQLWALLFLREPDIVETPH